MKKKFSKIKNMPKVIGYGGESFPEIFTVHPINLSRKKDEMCITEFTEDLIFDERKIAIDLFSGAGGFSLGLVNAGFRIVASVENDDDAHATYCANIPNRQKASIHCYHKDIRKVTGREILFNLGLKQGDIDLVVGGSPCPSFSLAGKRKVGDIRDALIFEFKRLVMEIQPKCWMMENVPGLKTKKMPDGTLVMDKFLEGMNVKNE